MLVVVDKRDSWKLEVPECPAHILKVNVYKAAITTTLEWIPTEIFKT